MQTLLVRLKPHDPRRGFILRRYTYRGIKFHEERGWYRVDKEVGEYLRSVRQVPGYEHAPLAFDVHTEAEAKALEADEDKATTRKKAADPVEATTAVTTSDLEDAQPKPDSPGSKRRTSRSK